MTAIFNASLPQNFIFYTSLIEWVSMKFILNFRLFWLIPYRIYLIGLNTLWRGKENTPNFADILMSVETVVLALLIMIRRKSNDKIRRVTNLKIRRLSLSINVFKHLYTPLSGQLMLLAITIWVGGWEWSEWASDVALM